MSKYNSDTCRICEFEKVCLKFYGNPHDGCTETWPFQLSDYDLIKKCFGNGEKNDRI